jgi:hypothetical protein
MDGGNILANTLVILGFAHSTSHKVLLSPDPAKRSEKELPPPQIKK